MPRVPDDEDDFSALLVLHGEVTAVAAESNHDDTQAIAGQSDLIALSVGASDEHVAPGRAAGHASGARVEVDPEEAALWAIFPSPDGAEVGQGEAGDRLVAQLQEVVPRLVQKRGCPDRPQALESLASEPAAATGASVCDV